MTYNMKYTMLPRIYIITTLYKEITSGATKYIKLLMFPFVRCQRHLNMPLFLKVLNFVNKILFSCEDSKIYILFSSLYCNFAVTI